MNNDSQFTTIGDEPVEARIVAWVLGEASAFEAAELERLCGEKPELMVFKRRMLALHGLLAEAENPQTDDAWKLPPEKRKAVEEIFGEEQPIRLEAAKEKRIRRSGRRAFLAIAACLILTVIIAGLMAPASMRQRKKSDVAEARSNELQRQLTLANSESRTQSLRTELPAELIEGTPRPMNVPNLEMPANGPAGSAIWAARENATVAEAAPIARVNPQPAAPSSSMAEVMPGALELGNAVPEPEVAITTPSIDFGDEADFGSGWGGGSGGGRGFANDSLRAGEESAEKKLLERSSLDRDSGLDAAAGDASSDVNGSFARANARAAADAGITGVRNTTYLSEHEPPDLPDTPTQSLAIRKPFPATPATPGDFEGRDAGERAAKPPPARGRIVDAGGQAKQAMDGGSVVYGERIVDAGGQAKLDDLIRTDPALTYEYAQNAEQVRSLRSQTEGTADKYRDASKVLADGKTKVNGYETHTGKKNEYLFLGLDPGKDGGKLPDDAQALAKVVRDQEEKVEERRKVLATIVRTKGVIHKGNDEMKDQSRKEAIKRGLDAQDYVDAKKEFEKDLELLQQMKLKLMASSMKAKPEAPKLDLTKLVEEIAAAEEPYSTFSLNISDASFQVAQAALAKGDQPDPAGIKVEQFYNAVDYGDPAPSADEPVAVSIEQAAHPVIPGRNLVRIALKTAAAGRSAAQPLRLTLLVDQSGSMVRADRRAAMDKALAGLSELLTANDLVTVIGFSRTPRLLADGMTGDKAGKLAGLVNQAASEGGTNLEEAIKLGEQMADRRKLAGAQNRIVLFTDGAANLGNADPQRLAEKVQQLRQKGIAFDIAGIAADGLNDELLGELARNGNGRYYVVGKGAEEDFAKQLAGAFRPAAENVKVQVRFNPERVGSYKLIGFEKDRLKTEDFRNDKVDAAELAAEEAGVAIYQVEPKPEGNGELGEVSVRFRDTASGEMVERTWTIPHDAAAPAIDRATPSMQLAALAMLAAEKLKGGPLGEAVDFQQLAVPQANVKQSYGNNARVGDVLRMVDMLK